MRLSKSPTITYIVFFVSVGVLFVPFALQVLPWFEWSDGCEHAAAVKELRYSLTDPQNPILDLPGNTSPRFVPSIIIMAIIQKITHMDIFAVLGWSSLALFLAMGIGIFLFAKEYFKDSYQPIYTLLCILFLWGKGWDGANGYMFSSLVFTAYYPSVVSFVGIFFALTALLKYIHQNKLIFSLLYIALSTFIVLNHPLTGFLFFLIAFLLVLTERPIQKKTLYLFALSFCIAIGLTVLWPYYSFIESVFSVTGKKAKEFWDYRATHQFLYSELFVRIGPGLLGIIPVLYFGAMRKHLFIVSGFISCSVLYALGYFFDISLAERCIFFCMFFSQLAFSRFLNNLIHAEGGLQSIRIHWFVKACFIAGLFVGTAAQLFLVSKVYLPQYLEWKPAFRIKTYQHPLKKYFTLAHYLQRGDIVLTDVFTSWIIPCITEVKVVSLLHNSPLVSDNSERLSDTMSFFTEPHSHQNILKKYRITHILIDKKKTSVKREQSEDSGSFLPYFDKQLMGQLSGFGKAVLDNEDFFLVEIGSPPGGAHLRLHDISVWPFKGASLVGASSATSTLNSPE